MTLFRFESLLFFSLLHPIFGDFKCFGWCVSTAHISYAVLVCKQFVHL